MRGLRWRPAQARRVKHLENLFDFSETEANLLTK